MNKAYICVLLTAFIFGTMEVALKIGASTMDPFQITYLRFAIGGLILLPFGIAEIRKRGIRLHLRDYLELAGIGFIGVVISMILFQLGVMSSNASTASVLFCVNPFFTMIFAHFFAGERMNRTKAVILLIAMVGIFFMLRPWDVQEGNTAYGMITMILAALTFGIYTVAAKGSIRKIGAIAQTGISFVLGAFILMVITSVIDRPVMAGITDNIPIILYTGIIVTGGGYFFYFKAIELADAATGAFAFFLKPAIAPVIAVIVLGEHILWNTYFGIGLILAASLINIVSQKKSMHIERVEEKRAAQRLDREEQRLDRESEQPEEKTHE